MRQDIGQQEHDRPDRGAHQKDWIDQRRLDRRGQAALPFEQIGEMRQAVRKLASRLAGPHQADIEPRKDPIMFRQTRCQGFSSPHRITKRFDDPARTLAITGFDQETQRVIDVLAGLEHQRQFAREMRDHCPGQAAAETQIGLQELQQAAVFSHLIGAQQEIALAMKAIGHGRRVCGLDHAVRTLACLIDGDITKLRHLTILRGGCFARFRSTTWFR